MLKLVLPSPHPWPGGELPHLPAPQLSTVEGCVGQRRPGAPPLSWLEEGPGP